MGAADPRARIAGRLDADDHRGAWAEMSCLVSAEATTAHCHVIAEALERLDAQRAGLTELRVALLANFTAEPLATILAARSVASGILVRPYVSAFDAWAQEILDRDSGLRQTSPDVVVLALTLEGLAPGLMTEFASLEPAQSAQLVEETGLRIAHAVAWLRSWTKAKILVHAFPQPSSRAFGVIDTGRADGQTAAFRALSERLHAVARDCPDVFVVELDRLVAAIGEPHWRDRRMAALGGLPYTMAALHAISEEHLRYLRAFCGRVRKVLVLDADDTLWGGVVGEVGLNGIALGEGYPGACFVDFQRAVLDLRARGVLLALNSTNNRSDVDDVLDGHPDMCVRRRHLSALRVNWDDKAANLVSMADELELGLESFVFMDDDVAECERVRRALPDVLTVHLAGDPSVRADLVRGLGVFDTLTFGEDDRRRAGRYREESARRELNRTLPSIDAYYESLAMELSVEPIGQGTLARAAELTQRTNQFNLAPRRFTRDELAAELSVPGLRGFIFRLRDRFGNHGLIAVAIVDQRSGVLRIQTLLMSCRVLKRTVEDTLLAFLAAQACDRGLSQLEGVYQPTARNQPAARFYADRGFTLIAVDPDGSHLYRRAIDPPPVASPWVPLTVALEPDA